MVSFRIASRFLKASRGQTVLIVLGIAIAISVQIFVGILITSLQGDLVDAVTGNSPHITITSADQETMIEDWESILVDVRGLDGITDVTASAYSPTLVGNGNKNISALVYGFELESANGIYGFGDSLTEGNVPDSETQAMIGTGLAEELSLETGEELTIVNNDLTSRDVEITGIFDLGNAQANSWVIGNLQLAQSVFGFGDNVTAVQAQVDDVFAADEVAASVASAVDTDMYQVENWKDNSADLLSALQSQSLSSYMIQAFVLVSVVIAISSVLAITVIQKSRQIGILKAMGIKDRQASMIFLFQGLLLGILGAVAGIGIGLFLLYGFVMGTSAGGDPIINIVIDYNFVTLSGCIAVISAVVASVLPARRSQKLSPVEVIRNG